MPQRYPPLSLALVIGAILVLSGCARQFTRPEDPSLKAVGVTAKRISTELARLNRMEQTQVPPIPSYPVPRGALSTPIEINWSGRLVPAVKAVASLIGNGWTVRVVGRPPVSSPLVTIQANHTPAYVVLESLGWQAGKHAGVVVNRAQRLIEVVYIGGANAS